VLVFRDVTIVVAAFAGTRKNPSLGWTASQFMATLKQLMNAWRHWQHALRGLRLSLHHLNQSCAVFVEEHMRRRRNSGESEPQMHISKQGDEYLRTLLVQGAHYILGPFGEDSDLRRWGQKLAERGGKTPRNERWWR
jgi:hypothetical protein